MIAFSDAPRGTCRWCGEAIVHVSGDKTGELDRRRRWHPRCVAVYNSTDPRELRRRVRRRDGGRCQVCGLDTYELKRRMKGRGMWTKLRAKGFVRRQSLWELDHIVALIDGGNHELSNLQTLCVPCHRVKSAAETRQRAARNRESEEIEGTAEPDRPDAPQAAPRSDPSDSPPTDDAVDRELDRLLARVDAASARVAATLDRGTEGARPRLASRSR